MLESENKVGAVYFKEMEKYTQRFSQITETMMAKPDVQLATCPKDLVFQDDIVRLYRFRSTAKIRCPVPLLINYALVNRETMMDLQEEKSLIRNLLGLGLDIYMIEWG
ncbi:MAG: hypothetical protein KJP07_03840, partial [Desulfatitalea sp.]|nr:hypothetical protein [Desulfatitalea sp.]